MDVLFVEPARQLVRRERDHLPIGGTVSGLSGTVVLQDNGGDDLSVSASGAFTFATALSAGSAYNVTVKTNPAGQTCSVANGSGTVGSAGVTNVAVTCTAAATYSDRRYGLGAVRHGGAAGQRRVMTSASAPAARSPSPPRSRRARPTT